MQKQRHSSVYQRHLSGSPAADPDRLLTVEQVSARLNCSKSNVYNLIQAGSLVSTLVGHRQGKRVYESSVVRFLELKGSQND